MADTASTEPVVPQEEQVNDLGYKYEDLQKETVREIAANTELPKEESAKTEEKPVIEEKEITLDEVGKDIAEKTATAMLAAQEARDKVAEETRVKAEEDAKKPATPQEEYQQIVNEFTTKEGRVPTWDELAVKIEERTIEKIESRQKAQQAEQIERAKQANVAHEEDAKKLNAYVDDEMQDLYTSGKLTPIKDAKNPSDQGVIERKELFRQWGEVNRQRLSEGKPEIISATRIYDYFYKKPNTQPAGATAPIAGNKSSAVIPSKEQDYTYADLKKPWGWFKGR